MFAPLRAHLAHALPSDSRIVEAGIVFEQSPVAQILLVNFQVLEGTKARLPWLALVAHGNKMSLAHGTLLLG